MTLEDCGANGCIFAPTATGMRTNGGCLHLKADPHEMRRLLRDAATLLVLYGRALDEARRERDEARQALATLAGLYKSAREREDALLDELAALVRALYLDDKPRTAAIARAAQVVIDHGRGDAEIEALARMRP